MVFCSRSIFFYQKLRDLLPRPPPRLSSYTPPQHHQPLVLRPSPRGSAMPSYANHHSPMDGRMDAMKSSAFSLEEPAGEAAANAALVEKGGFSVEDLLDLEEFGEPDAADAPPPPVTAAAADATETPGDSQPSSVVTYELPPPPTDMVDLPAHDVEELEWVSRIMDDSHSELPPAPQPLATAAQAARPPLPQPRQPYDGAYRALRPPTICALSTEALVPVKAKRSKRSRSSAWSVSGASLFSDSASSSSTATTSSCSSSGASFSSYFLMDAPPFGSPDLEGYHHFLPPQPKKSKHSKGGGKHKPKKRGRKPKNVLPLAGAAAASFAASQAGPGDRRCSHCGVQKTPQWRAGPMGAKTLCNACGVRFKSGRLLPEYRPACSPSFVSSIHSNSHRKVLEMRRKKEAGLVATGVPAVASF